MKKIITILITFMFLVGCSCTNKNSEFSNDTNNDISIQGDEVTGSNEKNSNSTGGKAINNNKKDTNPAVGAIIENNKKDSDSSSDGNKNTNTVSQFKLDTDAYYKAMYNDGKQTGAVSIHLKKNGKVTMESAGWENNGDAGGAGKETGTYEIVGNELRLHLTYYKSKVSMSENKEDRIEIYIITADNRFELGDYKFKKGKFTEKDFKN